MIGLLVASAMALGPAMVSASAETMGSPDAPADESSLSQGSASTVQADASQGANGSGAVSSDASGSAALTPSNASNSPMGQQNGEGVVADAQKQQPQAQSGSEGIWRDGTAPYRYEDAGNGMVEVHIGAGTIGSINWAPYRLNSQVSKIVIEGKLEVGSDLGSLFLGLQNLESIEGLSNIDTSHVTSMRMAFAMNPKLKSLDLSTWDVSHVANMGDMFSGDFALAEIKGISGWKTSSLEEMGAMFNGCGLRSLDLSGWDTSKVTNLHLTFGWMNDLETIDVTGWDVSHVVSMYGAFYNNQSLRAIKGVGTWEPDAVTDTTQMFTGDPLLTALDLSGWKGHTSNLERASEMFNGDRALVSLTGLANWDVSKVNTLRFAFAKTGLTTLDLSGWKPALAGEGAEYVFYDDSALARIDGLDGWNLGAVTSMAGMFWGVPKMTDVDDISGWNVSNVENMDYLFFDSNAIQSLDLGDWDTRKVSSATVALPSQLHVLKLGRNTVLLDQAFLNSYPGVYAKEIDGYTGRWTKASGKWTSKVNGVRQQTNDNYVLASYTRQGDFTGGKFVLQEWVEVAFRKNVPKGEKANNLPATIRAVGPHANAIKIKLPKQTPTRDGYRFASWNRGKRGGQLSYAPGETIDGLKRGKTTQLWAQWKEKSKPNKPSKPSVPLTLTYVVRYHGVAPGDKVISADMVQGSTSDDVFTVTVEQGKEQEYYTQYRRAAKASGYSVAGYHFAGWDTEADLDGGVFQAGSKLKLAPGPNDYYATWEKNEDTVPVNPGDGGQTPETPGDGDQTPGDGGQTPPRQTPPNPLVRATPIPTVLNIPVAAPAAPLAQGDAVAAPAPIAKPKPKCVPANVSNGRAPSAGHRASAAEWIEPDGTVHTASSEYDGLPRCSVAAPATATSSSTHGQLNLWWLLLLVAMMFLVILYAQHRNKYIRSQHYSGVNTGEEYIARSDR